MRYVFKMPFELREKKRVNTRKNSTSNRKSVKTFRKYCDFHRPFQTSTIRLACVLCIPYETCCVFAPLSTIGVGCAYAFTECISLCSIAHDHGHRFNFASRSSAAERICVPIGSRQFACT